MTTNLVSKTSPWGKIQTSSEIADGIQSVSTASHGGFKLDRSKQAKMPKSLKLKGGWYEEDVECFRVMLAFPECFDQKDVEMAHKTIKDYHPEDYKNWSGKEVKLEESFVLREEKFKKDNVNNYIVLSAFGSWHPKVPKGFVGVLAGKGGRLKNGMYPNDLKWFLIPQEEYDSKADMFFVIDTIRHQEIESLQN